MINCHITKMRFNSQQLIIFSDSITSGSRSCFYLPCIQRHRKISNGHVSRGKQQLGAYWNQRLGDAAREVPLFQKGLPQATSASLAMRSISLTEGRENKKNCVEVMLASIVSLTRRSKR